MKKLSYGVFCVVRFFVKVFYKKPLIVGTENLPDEPCVIVGNHTQMNGPIISELYLPTVHYTWCAGEMMHLKEVPAYAYRDFWSRKPCRIKWFFKLLSYVIAPLSVCVFNSAHTVAVYHDKRIMSTLRETMKKLGDGANIVIFPEHDAPHDNIVCDFQEGFVDVARLYYRQTGKILSFVPLYIAPYLHTAVFGKPIAYSPDNDNAAERERICTCLMQEIGDLARALPRHKVVPYNNLPKKAYVYSKEEEI